jgi:hypothetical protein
MAAVAALFSRKTASVAPFVPVTVEVPAKWTLLPPARFWMSTTRPPF